MTGPRHFDAPWSTTLKAVSALGTAVLLGVSVLPWVLSPLPPAGKGLLTALPLVILLGSLLFTIRGYELGERELWVERLGWRSRISLEGLQSVVFDPEAPRRSLRLCGNGGLFAFCGWFYCKKLRRYRMFATDLRRTVVLHFASRRVVVSPDEPHRFVEKVREIAGLD